MFLNTSRLEGSLLDQKKKENKNLTVKKFFFNFFFFEIFHQRGGFMLWGIGLLLRHRKQKTIQKGVFELFGPLDFTFWPKKERKKTFFQKKVFSTPVPISGTNPGPDPGPDSGESKQLIFALTFVIFSLEKILIFVTYCLRFESKLTWNCQMNLL